MLSVASDVISLLIEEALELSNKVDVSSDELSVETSEELSTELDCSDEVSAEILETSNVELSDETELSDDTELSEEMELSVDRELSVVSDEGEELSLSDVIDVSVEPVPSLDESVVEPFLYFSRISAISSGSNSASAPGISINNAFKNNERIICLKSVILTRFS